MKTELSQPSINQLDDPNTTITHGKIIQSKPILKAIYEDWYHQIITHLAPNSNKVLEIGSGGGFLKKKIPNLITSDILPLEICDMTFSAEEMPFGNQELDAIVMVNVFHHIPKPFRFLSEAERILKPGGRVIMIEPANTFLARFIYKNFHHEPFDETGGWEIEAGKPLSHSNQALPFIYFLRDRQLLEKKFKNISIKKIDYHTPFTYILSGGLSRKSIIPIWLYPLFRKIEKIASPFHKITGLFYTIVLEKKE